MTNTLAVELGDSLQAAVPFYGGQPASEDVARIQAAMLIQYAEMDPRINAGWPDFEAALQANNVRYQMHMYSGTNHGFHNNSTPRYDEAAAALAWERTIAFFREHLSS
jgi:carboxymethylenebutenolidase